MATVTNRVIIHLSSDERRALQRMAEANFRRPDDELRRLLTEEMKRVGFVVRQDIQPTTGIAYGQQ